MKQLLERYFYQLLDGCGNPECDNQYCASSEEARKLTPNEAAAEAIKLFYKEARLCDRPSMAGLDNKSELSTSSSAKPSEPVPETSHRKSQDDRPSHSSNKESEATCSSSDPDRDVDSSEGPGLDVASCRRAVPYNKVPSEYYSSALVPALKALVENMQLELRITKKMSLDDIVNCFMTAFERSQRPLITAFPACRSPGGSVRIGEDDRVLLERPPSSSRLRVCASLLGGLLLATAKTMVWRPATTPAVGTPLRSLSPAPGPSKRPGSPQLTPSKRRCESGPSGDDDMSNYLYDSGSGSEGEEGSGPEDDDPASMRLVAQRLREIAILEREEPRAVLDVLAEEGLTLADLAHEEDAIAVGAPAEDGPDVFPAGESGHAVSEQGPDYSYVWSEDFSTFSGRAEEYSRSPGPNIPLTNPLEIFNTIWDDKFLALVVQQTNEFAFRTIVALNEMGTLPKYLDNWVETTIEEMRRFFGLLIYMALDYRARVDEYWTTGTLEMPAFRAIMPRNRFQLLLRFLHFVDNDYITPWLSTYEKKIAKIAPIIKTINNKFSSLYTPERELSLDETLLLWKGRLSWVQCIRTKAARFGMKAFELCEASTGYLLRTILYAGKDSTFVDGPIFGFTNKTAKVVLELMDGYLDVGHAVVMDNWYNQIPLTRFLKSRSTDVLGTLNKNRSFVPNDIAKLDKKSLPREAQVARHCGDIAVIAWQDCQLVTVVTTYHGDQQLAGRRMGQTIMKPEAIGAYNKSMGGVDLKDLKLSGYLMERKRGHKWYKKVFFRLLNTSILNSYIIYSKNNGRSCLSHRAFRFNLAEALVSSGRAPVIHRSLPAADRLDGRNHFPSYTEATEVNKNKHARRRCVRCLKKGIKNKLVNTQCTKCKVPLCIGTCYKEYHTLQRL